MLFQRPFMSCDQVAASYTWTPAATPDTDMVWGAVGQCCKGERHSDVMTVACASMHNGSEQWNLRIKDTLAGYVWGHPKCPFLGGSTVGGTRFVGGPLLEGNKKVLSSIWGYK